jgi:protein subunit release factor A
MKITIKDCIVQTYRGSGAGGSNRNKRDTAVRIIHPPSGALGQAEDERHQLQNKKLAFRRMAESDEFQRWAKAVVDPEIPEASSTERIRTYNLIERRVTDHRTGHKSSNVQKILDGDIDHLYES